MSYILSHTTHCPTHLSSLLCLVLSNVAPTVCPQHALCCFAVLPAPQDPNLTTSWWVVQVGDPALSQPGPYEAMQHKAKLHWARDRNVRLPWDALRAVLEAAVTEAPRGGTEAYRAAAEARSQVWTLLPGRRLRRAGGAEEPY